MPIVLAIMSGGIAMLIFKDDIVRWITNKGYKCPKCSFSDWNLMN